MSNDEFPIKGVELVSTPLSKDVAVLIEACRFQLDEVADRFHFMQINNLGEATFNSEIIRDLSKIQDKLKLFNQEPKLAPSKLE